MMDPTAITSRDPSPNLQEDGPAYNSVITGTKQLKHDLKQYRHHILAERRIQKRQKYLKMMVKGSFRGR